MDTKRLISATVLYGLADVVVVAVGGFLLLPMYTRTLTQAEFGTYVVVRANTEFFTYLLYFGLPSAVARVYFDYRERDEHGAYLSSVVLFFLSNLVLCGVALALWGDRLWSLLSPTTPALPYMWFAFSIAAAGFFAALGSMLLRLEGRVRAFTSLQLATAALLVGAAVIGLVVLKAGLTGLLTALLVSSLCSAAVLPMLIGRRFRVAMVRAHIVDSMRYAAPILVGYVAYFVLNRVSTLILQRHVEVAQIAVFGVAQQLAMIIAIAAAAFGKAVQPAVYGATPREADELMARAAKILILLMCSVTSLVVLFSAELFSLVAPASYGSGLEILLILAVASFAYSFSFISDTALLYHRRPRTSVAVSLTGALVSTTLGLWLIPRFELRGAAVAIAVSFLTVALLGHAAAFRVTRQSYLREMLIALSAVCVLAALVDWLRLQGIPLWLSASIKGAVVAAIGTTFLLHSRKRAPDPCSV